MKYGNLTLGRIEAIVNKLGGMEGVQRLLNDETMVVERLQEESPVWFTVKLEGLSGPELRKRLQEVDIAMNGWAEEVLRDPDFAEGEGEEREVDLVVLSMADVGLRDGGLISEFHQKAVEAGYELCPFEVAPQYYLQCFTPVKTRVIPFAMKAVQIYNRTISAVFRAGPDALSASPENIPGGYNNGFWPADYRAIFIQPRK